LDIANPGDWTALFVWLEDARPLDTLRRFFADNHFCTSSQKRRTVQVEWDGVPRKARTDREGLEHGK
jgi:hypothetical protein